MATCQRAAGKGPQHQFSLGTLRHEIWKNRAKDRVTAYAAVETDAMLRLPVRMLEPDAGVIAIFDAEDIGDGHDLYEHRAVGIGDVHMIGGEGP